MPLTPTTTPNDFFIQVARGLIPDERLFQTFGVHSAVGPTLNTVWGGENLYSRPMTAETVNVVSTSANDAFGNTGAEVVAVIGVDASYNEIVDVIVMNGTTPVLSSLAFKEINQFVVVQAGTSSNPNVGTITATRSGDAIKIAHMRPSEGLQSHAFVTIPAGRYGYVDAIRLGAQGQGVAEFRIRTSGISGTDPTPPLTSHIIRVENSDTLHLDLGHAPLILPSGTRISVMARNPINNKSMWASALITMNTAPASRFLSYSTLV